MSSRDLPERDPEMADWIRRYGKHPRVRSWLKRYPPPATWRGTPEEWAYTEMTAAPGTLSGALLEALQG